MTLHHALRTIFAAIMLAATTTSAAPTAQTAPLTMDKAWLSIEGTSNIHDYTAWTDTVRVTRVTLAAPIAAETFWDDILKPGMVEGFEVEIPVATLTSSQGGLDKNMYKALKLDAYRVITFRLARFERATGALMAVGVLSIAGVERDVVLPLETARRGAGLMVKGTLALQMTDYGIQPPTAMLGMLKTHPTVTVRFETVLSVPST